MSNPWNLPPRQEECVRLLAVSGCNKLIARELGLDPRTVEAHLSRAFQRMEVANRILAAVKWDRWVREAQS